MCFTALYSTFFFFFFLLKWIHLFFTPRGLVGPSYKTNLTLKQCSQISAVLLPTAKSPLLAYCQTERQDLSLKRTHAHCSRPGVTYFRHRDAAAQPWSKLYDFMAELLWLPTVSVLLNYYETSVGFCMEWKSYEWLDCPDMGSSLRHLMKCLYIYRHFAK